MSNNGIKNQSFSTGTWLCDMVTWFMCDLCLKKFHEIFNEIFDENILGKIFLVI